MYNIPNDQDHRITVMTTLSPLAKQKLDTEGFRTMVETDDVEGWTVEQEMLLCLIDDMREIGLELTCNISDWWNDKIAFTQSLSALGWVMPATLFPRIRDDEEFATAIDALLSGSIDEGSVIAQYLDYVGGDGEQSGYRHDLLEGAQVLKSCLRSTGIFDDYLRHLLHLLRDERVSQTHLIDDVHGYTAILKRKAMDLEDARSVIVQALNQKNHSFYDQFERRVRLSIRTLFEPDRINLLGWLFTAGNKPLADDAQRLYTQRMMEFTQSFKLCVPYFTTRAMTLTEIDVLGIVCFVFANSAYSSLDLKTKLTALMSQVPSHHDLISRCYTALDQHLASHVLQATG